MCTESHTITLTSHLLDDPSLFDNDTSNGAFKTISNIDNHVNEDENDDSEELQQGLPLDFTFLPLPEEI